MFKNKAEHPQTKIKGKIRVLLVEAKQKYNYGPEKMRIYLKKETGAEISSIAIYKFMKKRHLIRKPQKETSLVPPNRTIPCH